MTWYWRQKHGRANYTADHVNTWAAMVRRNCSLDIEIACVTNHPEGIDGSIRIIPSPADFEDISTTRWMASQGMPQCYRRIAMYAPHAADWIGSERFVSMDMDVVVMGSVDSLWDRPEPIVLYRGSSAKRPYNGSMVLMTAGAESAVYTKFSQEKAERASRLYLGSDQAWISHCLGKGKPTWHKQDGVYSWGRGVEEMMRRKGALPDNARMLFTPGPRKPWHLSRYPAIAEHYRP